MAKACLRILTTKIRKSEQIFMVRFFLSLLSVVCDRFTNLVSFGVNMNDITAFGFDMRLQCLFFFV